jgi:tetratricopeptide (TPR) repeat protein
VVTGRGKLSVTASLPVPRARENAVRPIFDHRCLIPQPELTLRYVLWLSIAVTLAGCSAKRAPLVSPQPAPIDLAPADALLQAGCYRCLTEAYTLYERARTSPAPPPRARDGAFVTAALLALREKDLDLESTPWLARARALATADEAVYLDVVAALPWDGGLPPDFAPDRTLAADTLTRWRTAPPGLYPLLDTYLRLTLECRLGTRASFADTLRQVDLNAPVLQYRAGLCGAERRPLLEQLVAHDTRFAEAWYFIGRYEMATGVTAVGLAGNKTWLTSTVKPLSDAHAGLPEVPTITSVLAGLMRARNELRRALSLYEEALALRPTHGEALFGRLVTLSYLRRQDEAIAAATAVIAGGRGHVGSAFYYRAWNEYQKERLDEAARDIATAKRMQAPEEVLVVSGMVAYAQMRKADARADFVAAVAGNDARCIAHWFLGLLNLDEDAWGPAVSTFSAAAGCYVAAGEAVRLQAAQLPDDLPADVRAEQMAEFEETIAENARQAGRSFFNAAQAAMRIGDTRTALRQAREALSYEDVRERADAMVKRLEH